MVNLVNPATHNRTKNVHAYCLSMIIMANQDTFYAGTNGTSLSAKTVYLRYIHITYNRTNSFFKIDIHTY